MKVTCSFWYKTIFFYFKEWIFIGWITSFLIISSISTFQYQSANKFTGIEMSLYDVFSRLTWTLAMCFIIFAWDYGYAGPVNWFLSLSHWKTLSRLSYAIYLIHFSIMLTFTLSAKQPVFLFQSIMVSDMYLNNYNL